MVGLGLGLRLGFVLGLGLGLGLGLVLGLGLGLVRHEVRLPRGGRQQDQEKAETAETVVNAVVNSVEHRAPVRWHNLGLEHLFSPRVGEVPCTLPSLLRRKSRFDSWVGALASPHRMSRSRIQCVWRSLLDY